MVLTRTLSPGAYLRHRREAAMLSIADVADMFHTQPRWSEIDRIDWLGRIEADVEQPTFRTIVALRSCFSFDIDVLGDLVAIAHGAAIDPPRLCRICACSEFDACSIGDDAPASGCGWAARDLCTACAPPEPPQPGDPVAAIGLVAADADDAARLAA